MDLMRKTVKKVIVYLLFLIVGNLRVLNSTGKRKLLHVLSSVQCRVQRAMCGALWGCVYRPRGSVMASLTALMAQMSATAVRMFSDYFIYIIIIINLYFHMIKS